MVRAEIKDIMMWPGEAPGREPTDIDPTHFGFEVQVFIGTSHQQTADSFDIVVCSPSWLAAEMAAGRFHPFITHQLTGMDTRVIPGNRIWLMQRWSRADLEAAVRNICEAMSPAPDWGTLASRIGRWLPWEYDYQYDDHIDAHFGEVFPRSDQPPPVR